METTNNKIIIIIVLATIFGLLSGIVGSIVARVYLLEDAFNIPLFGEIRFSNSNYDGSNLVIRSPKKVVVEQNVKVVETVNSVKRSIVGIYKKKEVNNKKTETDRTIENYYKINEEIAEGFVITSDGWLITNFITEELDNSLAVNKYIVITKDRDIYEVDKIINDKNLSVSFWHINADDLLVRNLASEKDISNGQIVVAVNWDGWTWLSTVLGKEDFTENLVISSDIYRKKIILEDFPESVFYGSFLFSLNGDLLGLINDEGIVEPITNYISCITCVLESNEIKRAGLGVNYIDLATLVNSKKTITEKGVLIYKNKNGIAVEKGSPAEIVGLKEGDIITKVNNIELDEDNCLNSIVAQSQVGDVLDIVYLRLGEEKTVSIKLEEIKQLLTK